MPGAYATHKSGQRSDRRSYHKEDPSRHLKNFRRDQRAICFAPQATGRPSLPLDHARSTAQTARSSRAASVTATAYAAASVRSSVAALRSGFIPLYAPFQPALHLPARRPQTEADELAYAYNTGCLDASAGANSQSASTIRSPYSHSTDSADSAMKSALIVWRRRARQGYCGVGSLDARASVPP